MKWRRVVRRSTKKVVERHLLGRYRSDVAQKWLVGGGESARRGTRRRAAAREPGGSRRGSPRLNGDCGRLQPGHQPEDRAAGSGNLFRHCRQPAKAGSLWFSGSRAAAAPAASMRTPDLPPAVIGRCAEAVVFAPAILVAMKFS